MNSRLLRYCASLILTYKSCCELSKQETWVLVQIQQNSGPVRLKCEHHVDQTRLKDKVVARKSLNLIYSIKKKKKTLATVLHSVTFHLLTSHESSHKGPQARVPLCRSQARINGEGIDVLQKHQGTLIVYWWN